MNCKIVFTSEVKCQIQGLSLEDKRVLYNKYSFFVPSARFSPLYKLGRWNGKVYYFTEGGSTYVSLLPEIIQYLTQKGYEITYETYFKRPDFKFPEIDENYLSDIKWYKGHKLEGQSVELFEHQVRVINALLKAQHGIANSCTSSGKTAISLALAKAVLPYGKFLMIEPSADLTIQTANFYKNLGFKCGIVGLGKREFDNNIIVATWQTLLSLDRRGKKKTAKDKDILLLEDLEKLKKDTVALTFDECFDGDTLIYMLDGSLKKIKDCKIGDKIISFNEITNSFEEDIIEKVYINLPKSSKEDMYEIELEDGNLIKVTGNHKILTQSGWKEVKNLTSDDDIIKYK